MVLLLHSSCFSLSHRDRHENLITQTKTGQPSAGARSHPSDYPNTTYRPCTLQWSADTGWTKELPQTAALLFRQGKANICAFVCAEAPTDTLTKHPCHMHLRKSTQTCEKYFLTFLGLPLIHVLFHCADADLEQQEIWKNKKPVWVAGSKPFFFFQG